MSFTLTAPPRTNALDRQIVEPAVFAAQLVSRETLVRIHLPESGLVGLRNTQTGETLYVRESGLQRWLQARD